jgi:hypothetical protein
LIVINFYRMAVGVTAMRRGRRSDLLPNDAMQYDIDEEGNGAAEAARTTSSDD